MNSISSGSFYAIIGATLWGIASIFSKVGVSIVGPWSSILIRSLCFCSVVTTYSLYIGQFEINKRTSVYGVLSGLTMGAAVISSRFAYSLFEVSQVVPIQRLSVVVTVIIGIVCFNEKVNRRKIYGIMLSVLSFMLLSPV